MWWCWGKWSTSGTGARGIWQLQRQIVRPQPPVLRYSKHSRWCDDDGDCLALWPCRSTRQQSPRSRWSGSPCRGWRWDGSFTRYSCSSKDSDGRMWIRIVCNLRSDAHEAAVHDDRIGNTARQVIAHVWRPSSALYSFEGRFGTSTALTNPQARVFDQYSIRSLTSSWLYLLLQYCLSPRLHWLYLHRIPCVA